MKKAALGGLGETSMQESRQNLADIVFAPPSPAFAKEMEVPALLEAIRISLECGKQETADHLMEKLNKILTGTGEAI